MSTISSGMIDYILLIRYHCNLLSTNQHESISFIIAPTLIQTHLLFILLRAKLHNQRKDMIVESSKTSLSTLSIDFDLLVSNDFITILSKSIFHIIVVMKEKHTLQANDDISQRHLNVNDSGSSQQKYKRSLVGTIMNFR